MSADTIQATMTATRWQAIKRILADALELEGAAARAAFVATACGDDATLRDEVESFLAREAGTLDQYADGIRASREVPESHAQRGRRVGAYTLERELGRGGMGAVWLARRADGRFEQLVAIKLLKRGTDTEEVLRRFRSERQILARLEHPNIARLLDGGETDEGLPFFVLEYVAGARVNDFVRAAELSVARRLGLFIKICAAVQHAHQNLVVHRDLKPGNILVTPEGEPKLLDFGIAKLLALEDDDSSAAQQQHTLASHSRLTPAYASPEQARGEPVTTASDIYSLGALLYELLTDRTPHRFSRPRPSPTELVRIIGEQPAARPSLVAENTVTRSRLRGDLDNILLKALEKDPARRYPTANAFAEDLRRHLEGLPVRARAITWRYAAGKFIARNRLAVGAAASLVLSLIVGLGATVRMANVAQHEKQRAEGRFNDMRRLAHAMLFEVNDAIERGPTVARQMLVQRAVENLDKLSADPEADVDLRRDLATAYQKIGDVESRLHAANIGDTAGAIVSYRKALALRESLLAEKRNPADARALAGDHGRLGDMLSKTGDTAGALAAYRRAVELLETDPLAAVAADRDAQRERGRMCDRLGSTLVRTGDIAQGLRYISAGHAIRTAVAEAAPEDVEAQVDVARSNSSLAYVYGSTGRAAEALALDRRNAALFSRLTAEHPADLSLRRSEMDGHEWIGLGLTATGDYAGARAEFRLALALAEEALERDPANAQAHNDLGDVLHEFGDAERLSGNPLAAVTFYRRAIRHYRAVADADPVNVHARRQVAHVQHRLALALGASGDAPAAVAALRAVLPRMESLAAGDPANVEYAHDFARGMADLGHWLAAAGDLEAARHANAQADLLYDALARRAPADTHIAAERAALKTALALPAATTAPDLPG